MLFNQYRSLFQPNDPKIMEYTQYQTPDAAEYGLGSEDVSMLGSLGNSVIREDGLFFISTF